MFFFLRQGIFFVIPLSRAGRIAARMMCQPFGHLPTRPTSEVGEAAFSARVSRFLSSFIEPPFRSLVCPGALPVSAPLPPVLSGCEPPPVRYSPGRSAFRFIRLTHNYSGPRVGCQRFFDANKGPKIFFSWRRKQLTFSRITGENQNQEFGVVLIYIMEPTYVQGKDLPIRWNLFAQ